MSLLLSRRNFIAGSALATLSRPVARGQNEQVSTSAPIALWSEVCQELRLDFEQTAALTAESGCDGIDCPVRPGGQVLPERAGEDLPKIAESLARQRSKLLLITTDIQNLKTPHAEAVLRSASKLGVKHYRLGYWKSDRGISNETALKSILAGLKELSALNQQLGLCGVMQNHPGDELIGADLQEYIEICRAFPPEQIGIAFDIGHALRTLGEKWRDAFLNARSHVRVVYCRDYQPGRGYVALGEGAVEKSGFFALLREIGYRAPISLHMEYEWHRGKTRDYKTLVTAIRKDAAVLRRWLTG